MFGYLRFLSVFSSFITAQAYTYFAGHRCLLRHCASRDKLHQNAPPLVIVPGFAQTIELYENHLQALAEKRHVLIYEALGVGCVNDTAVLDNVTLPMQATRLIAAIQAAFPNAESVDLVGFSLGGRICLATVCVLKSATRPGRFVIRKLHLTGVALKRSDNGYLQLLEWKDHLRNHNMRAFAWSALTASYSASFLRKNERRLDQWITSLCNRNSVNGLSALLHQTHEESESCEIAKEWSVEEMVRKCSAGNPINGCLLVGELDVMSPVEHVQELASRLKWDPPAVVKNAGHALPFEAPSVWRNDVLKFLDEDVLLD